jgi:hypothetical protein
LTGWLDAGDDRGDMGAADLVEVPAAAPEVLLPHRCAPDEREMPIPYQIGPRGRERLAAGETVPVTARCRRCDGRVFMSLVDPLARASRRAAARPDPTALRRPASSQPGAGRTPLRPSLRLVSPPSASEPARCPACGVVPDAYGLCRCSM